MILSVTDYLKVFFNCKGFLIIFFSVLSGNGFSQDYNFRNFSSEDGLAQSYVYSIIQDMNGYLWIGTGNGLSKYNGFKFENFSTNDSLADNYITCGIRDGENLWFGHPDGRITNFNGKEFQVERLPKPDLSPITHFAKSPDGSVWASTYADGLLKLSMDTSAVRHYILKDQVLITSFEFLDNSDFIAGTNTGLLHCRLNETGEIEIISRIPEIPESKVTCIQKMRNISEFYIATENDGLFQLGYAEGLFKISGIFPGQDSNLTGLQFVYEDSRSDLWLGTFGNGLIKISKSGSGEVTKTLIFNSSRGFPSDNIKILFEDREGNIWSGNYGEGLTLITPKTFSVYKFDNTLYGNDIFSICFSGQYRWAGTGNGLVKMDQLTGRIIKFYGKGSGLPKDTVTSVYSADGKELWIGTGKSGLFRMDPENEKIIRYPLGSGFLENSITVIAGKSDLVWVGTKKGLCRINLKDDSAKWYTISKGGLPHNSVNSLYLDRSDKLWVTTSSNTLAYIQDEKVFKIPLNSVNGTSTLGPVTEDTFSGIWVGSNGNGVFKIESDSIINLTAKEGLLSNYCYSLASDDQNNIWVGHKGGISKIRITDFSIKPVHHIENITDSYQFNRNAIIKDPQDKIWFGSDQGIVSYDPAMEYQQFLAPVLVITSLKINDEEKNFKGDMVLSPGKYKIRIDFLGICLKEPTLVTYQYMMEGYDQWSEITKNTYVTYNLTEGEYAFILKASSGDGAVSENPMTIRILIKIPVWKKWWFYLISVSVVTALVFFYIKRREYSFLAEKRILEEKVTERTYEIQSQKNELVLQSNIIDEKNESITASIRYASHIQNAVLPPLELLDELLPDNFILSKPKDIVSGDFYWMSEMNNKIIIAVADCTGHGVPGAFMSVLGITLLNSIVNIQGCTDSDVIVTKLRDRVLHSLKQGRKNVPTSDGMDITLCVLDKQTKKLQFTGGMNDLVYVRDGILKVVKADRLSVCVYYDHSNPYTREEFVYKKGDVLFLFSDGFKDQFGGPYDKKYLSLRFYAKLLEIHSLPMSDQKEILDTEIIEWMKNTNQTDDITVMGIRL
jgi:ligand-binding sensor domain-containing protein/serine phosphatase RsbU (regulator of sigma subunit)